jgi:hypothetical protein
MKYNLLVETEDKRFEKVKLPASYKWDFIGRFGLERVPTKAEFIVWLAAFEAYQTVSEYEKSFEEFFKEMRENEKINSTSKEG